MLKRGRTRGTVIALALTAMVLASCGKSVFEVTGNTEKMMTITAEKADKDAFFMIGSLEVEDGEQITIASDLTKGSVRVEIVGPDQQSIDENPNLDGEVVITADLHSSDGASGTVPAGSYMMRATCLEKATGTVQITVEPVK